MKVGRAGWVQKKGGRRHPQIAAGRDLKKTAPDSGRQQIGKDAVAHNQDPEEDCAEKSSPGQPDPILLSSKEIGIHQKTKAGKRKEKLWAESQAGGDSPYAQNGEKKETDSVELLGKDIRNRPKDEEGEKKNSNPKTPVDETAWPRLSHAEERQ